MPVKTKQPSEMERRANILEMKASPYALLMSPLITLLLACEGYTVINHYYHIIHEMDGVHLGSKMEGKQAKWEEENNPDDSQICIIRRDGPDYCTCGYRYTLSHHNCVVLRSRRLVVLLLVLARIIGRRRRSGSRWRDVLLLIPVAIVIRRRRVWKNHANKYSN
jgi:hypothetical protein